MSLIKWKIVAFFRIVGSRVIRFVISVFCLFPIKRNRILFHSFKGRQYSCNPKEISEYLSNYYDGKFELIWAFREPDKYKYLEEKNIKVVNYISIRRFFLEVTAGFSVNNVGSFSWLPQRNGQIHLNTWHGGGCYKKLSTEMLGDKAMKLTVKRTTHMVSSSKFFSKYVVNGEFGFDKNILEFGMPRNDIFFQIDRLELSRCNVREKLVIPSEKLVVLYAPTWRVNWKIKFPDFEHISKAIVEKYGREAFILIRTHVYYNNNELELSDLNIRDVTDYPDMQELLCAADILITDYSSSIWDYSFLYRPCFLYAADVEEYIKDRGFCKDIYSWGFPVCRNDEELYDAIINFDADDFRKKMEKHHEDLGSFEDGHATEKICRFLVDTLENDQRKE